MATRGHSSDCLGRRVLPAGQDWTGTDPSPSLGLAQAGRALGWSWAACACPPRAAALQS